MSAIKVFKKGEILFKENDKITNVYVIQSGSVNICLQRPKKNIDIATLGNAQVLGESCLIGSTSHSFTAIAILETKCVELPVEIYKQQVESAPQILKVIFKSVVERIKQLTQEVRSVKMEKDSSPCPEDQVAKIFGSLFHAMTHKGQQPDEKEKNKYTIEWSLLKQYAQRIFSESPKRLEQAATLLVKIKLATFEMGKAPDNPEGPDELQRVNLLDAEAVESFFEFYQYYYFKGGKGEILKPDDQCINWINEFVELSGKFEADRYGVVTLEYQKVIEHFQNELGLTLKPDHFSRLEQKGVFVKRATKADGSIVLQFEVKEFKNTLKIWKILKEIEKWNEKGFIDLNEQTINKPKKKASGHACPQCENELPVAAKFCSECGFKIEAKAS